MDSFLRTKESKFQEINETKKKWGNEDLDPTGYVNNQRLAVYAYADSASPGQVNEPGDTSIVSPSVDMLQL